jgi:hypothetical protein
MNRQENFKLIKEENPKFARMIKHDSFLINFNKDYAEILEDDLFEMSQNLKSLYESDNIFRQLGRL